MKKVLSIICILMLCLPAVAQKKSSSKSSSKKASSSATYSGGSRSSAPVTADNHRGQVAIWGDINYYGETQIVTATNAGQVQTTTTIDPNQRGIDFGFSVGASVFVLDRLEVGGGLGFTSNKLYLGPDINNDPCYRTTSWFDIRPQIIYHIPLCSWLHYAPCFYTDFGFGKRRTERQINNPTITVERNVTNIIVGLEAARFEFRPSKNTGLVLSAGGFFFNSMILRGTDVNNNPTTTVNNVTSLSLFGNASVGFRYYFN